MTTRTPRSRKPAKPNRTKKMVVKGWAVIESDGAFRKLFQDKNIGDLNVSSYAGELLVPCTISYQLPLSDLNRYENKNVT